MSSKRNIMLFGSLALVTLAVAGWFLLLSPRMATAGELDTQRDSVATTNEVTRAQIAELQTMKDDISTAKADADLLTRRFPPTAAQAMLFEHIRQAAFSAGLPERKISTLTITVPTIGASDGSVSLGGPAPSAAAPPSAPGTVPPTATPAAGAGGQLATMNVDLSVSGPSERLAALLSALEDMDRAFLVTSVNLGSATGSSTLTLTGKMFLLPELVDPTAPVDEVAPTDGASGTEPAIDPATGATIPETPDDSTETPTTP